MNGSPKLIHASSLSDVLYHMQSTASLKIMGGCTSGQVPPEYFLSVRSISELLEVSKHERSIEIGSAVTMGTIVRLGRTNVPAAFFDAAEGIGNNSLRNLATVGGNICSSGCGEARHLISPLAALEARLEFRRGTEASHVPFSQFKGAPEGWLLTKIRLPLTDWKISIFRRLGPACVLDENSAGFTFLADFQKNILTDVRVAFAGRDCLRFRELEAVMEGSRLPLSAKAAADYAEAAEDEFDKSPLARHFTAMARQQFLNLTASALQELA